MRVSLLYLAVLALFLAGCKFETSKPLIPEQQLIDLLVDIHAVDGTLTAMGYKVVKDSAKIGLHYNYIFQKHNVSHLTFQKTLQYYANHPEDYELIYEQIIEKLTIMKGQLEEEKEAERKKPKKPVPIEKGKE